MSIRRFPKLYLRIVTQTPLLPDNEPIFNPFAQPSLEDNRPLLIAGPCSAESLEQLRVVAARLSQSKRVHLFRAGLWKPRTRPNTFEGKGEIALEWLAQIRAEFRLPVATEVASTEHVEACLKAGLDVMWIGARTAVSPFAVQEIANALRGTRIPVLVKNPMHADLKLWLGAIERVESTVQGPVWALHRGFSSYGMKDYRNAPMWEIPIGLRACRSDIPMLCDPSHIAGRRDLLSAVAQKAMDLGMHGLMIETHPEPEKALSDPEQQLTPAALFRLLDDLVIREEQPTEVQWSGLSSLRMQMDSVDEQLIELLASRMTLARQIGELKIKEGITILQLERWREVFSTRTEWAKGRHLNVDFIQKMLEQLHKESIRVQTEVQNRGK